MLKIRVEVCKIPSVGPFASSAGQYLARGVSDPWQVCWCIDETSVAVIEKFNTEYKWLIDMGFQFEFITEEAEAAAAA